MIHEGTSPITYRRQFKPDLKGPRHRNNIERLIYCKGSPTPGDDESINASFHLTRPDEECSEF